MAPTPVTLAAQCGNANPLGYWLKNNVFTKDQVGICIFHDGWKFEIQTTEITQAHTPVVVLKPRFECATLGAAYNEMLYLKYSYNNARYEFVRVGQDEDHQVEPTRNVDSDAERVEPEVPVSKIPEKFLGRVMTAGAWLDYEFPEAAAGLHINVRLPGRKIQSFRLEHNSMGLRGRHIVDAVSIGANILVPESLEFVLKIDDIETEKAAFMLLPFEKPKE